MEFPKYLHVTVEGEGKVEYLQISSSPTAEGALTSTEEKQRVATYELKEINEGKLTGRFSRRVG